MEADVKFKSWTAYLGTSTIDRRRQKLFVVFERNGQDVVFANAKDLKRVRVEDVCGAEGALIKDDDGFDYFASARLPKDADEMLALMDILK